MNPKVPWAHHAMGNGSVTAGVLLQFCLSCVAHVMEESHDAPDGVEFLTSTRPNWKNSAFGNHIAWHLALHYFGKLK